jgi:hypothetical protein
MIAFFGMHRQCDHGPSIESYIVQSSASPALGRETLPILVRTQPMPRPPQKLSDSRSSSSLRCDSPSHGCDSPSHECPFSCSLYPGLPIGVLQILEQPDPGEARLHPVSGSRKITILDYDPVRRLMETPTQAHPRRSN